MTSIRMQLLILLLVCTISNAAPLGSNPGIDSKRENQQLNVAPNNPFFAQLVKTNDDKTTDAEEMKDRKESLSIQADVLKVAMEALEASKDASIAANHAVLLYIVMASIAAVQVIMFFWQLWLMRDSNKLAAEAATAAMNTASVTKTEFEAAHRPWIKVELKLVGDFIRNKNGDWLIPIEFTMKNIGNNVAQCVYPYPGFFVGEGFVKDVLKEQDQLASKSNQIVDSGNYGFTIFPNDSFKVTIAIPLPAKNVTEKMASLVDIGFTNYLPHLYIVGSIHYKSAIGNAKYRTGFIRQFGSSEEARPGRKIPLPQQDVINLDKLALSQYAAGDGYID